MRWLVVLLIPVLACKGEGEQAPSEAAAPAPAPVLSWGLSVGDVQYTDGNLTVMAGLAVPTADAPDTVWLGVSARKPDGTVVDGPTVSGAPTELGSTVNLTHGFGPGFTEVAAGVWGADPACPEESEEPCPDRLSRLGDALVAWPDQGDGGPVVAKLDREIGVSVVEAGANSEVVRLSRAAAVRVLSMQFDDSAGFSVGEVEDGAGEPAEGITVRHRDLSDATEAAAVAAELGKAFEGVEIGVAHAPGLADEFELVLGTGGEPIQGYKVPSDPVRMVRPGLGQRSRKRLDELQDR